MNTHPILRLMAVCLLPVSTLSACGGSDGDNDVVPTGEPISNVSFVDSDSYYPLDKLRPNGSYFNERDKDYGTRNPAHVRGNQTTSIWAIDTSASAPQGSVIRYSMKIESISADSSARASLIDNLKINSSTGFISQSCQGFPDCYDNTTGSDQVFQISAIATVDGSSRSLTRTFEFKVIHNN